MPIQLSLPFCICSTTFIVCCVFSNVVLANTELLLEFVHPLAYTSISNFSAAAEDFARPESQTCLDGTQGDAAEEVQFDSWLGWLRFALGAFGAAFLNWYSLSLESNPVITKSITSALMGGLGDGVAQAMEMWTNGNTWERSRLNIRRVFSIAAEGLFVSGPLMHYSYEMMEAHLPIFAEDNEANYWQSWYMTICQVSIDMLVMDSVYVATMMITSALLEGRRKDIGHEMVTGYIPAVKVSWFSSFCWAPVQCLSFKYIPYNYRVLAINLQDIAWNASVSYMAHKSRHKNSQESTDEQNTQVQCH